MSDLWGEWRLRLIAERVPAILLLLALGSGCATPGLREGAVAGAATGAALGAVVAGESGPGALVGAAAGGLDADLLARSRAWRSRLPGLSSVPSRALEASGVQPAEFARRAAKVMAKVRDADIPLAGLMCLPPAGIEPAPFFSFLAKLADDNGVDGLSMGMSGDYATAVQLGAPHIRVGTALFGARG